MEYLVFFLIFVIFFGTHCSSQQVEEQKRCNVAYKCSSEPMPVWTTTDYTACEVFRNNCQMLNENCQRVNRNELEAVLVPEEDCKLLCGPECPAVDVEMPICGYLNEERRTFPSECEMRNYRCRTGETFDLLAPGPCPTTSA